MPACVRRVRGGPAARRGPSAHRPAKPGHHVLMTDECSNVSLVVMEFLNTNSPSTQCVGGLANQVKALRKGDNFFFAHI